MKVHGIKHALHGGCKVKVRLGESELSKEILLRRADGSLFWQFSWWALLMLEVVREGQIGRSLQKSLNKK